MTKYTDELRQELHEFILESTMVKRIFTMGIAGAAKAKPGILLARAMGFNRQGKFSVNGERLEGSKNKWQRYFAKGCPELIEYLTRVDLLMGQDARNFDDYFDSPVPRNKEGEVQMPLSQVGTEEPSEELQAWVAQLPDWGELYTPKGLNFFVLFSLYNIETGDNPNYKQLLRLCDSYDSPYSVRFCQGVPQNDAEALYQYTNDRNLLLGNDVEAEYTEAPEPESTDPYGDYLKELQAEATRREVEKLQEQARALAKEIRGVDISKLVLPTTPSELRIFNSKLMGIQELENELYPASEETFDV